MAPGRKLETHVAVICHEELSAVCHSAHLRTGELRHVDAAIEHLRTTTALTEQLGRVGRRAVDRAALGRLWCDRSMARDTPSPAADALKALAELAVALRQVPAGHRLFGPVRRAYARALRRLTETGDAPSGPAVGGAHARPALDLAAEVVRDTLTEVDAADPEYARCLLELARIGAARGTDRAQAVEAAREAAEHHAADLVTRIEGALLRARTAQELGRFDEATQGYGQVIGLLPRAASRALRRDDQERQLARWDGMPSEAAACALAAGRPEQAVQLLEQGRGVLLARALDTRGDLAELRAAHPELAERLDGLAAREIAYENSGPATETSPGTTVTPVAALWAVSTGGWAGHPDPGGLRRRLADDWDALLEEIRARPGFEDFAGPPRLDRLRQQAADGPIVYLNVASFRSDALVLLRDRVLHVPLSVTPHDVEARLKVLHHALDPRTGAALDAQRAVHGVLAWMWDELAEPVLQAVPGRPRRVWWVPTGQLTQLPLHAAGHHATRHEPRPRTVLDRVVSSYTPTVRALVAARAHPPAGPVHDPLVVAVPSVHGHRPLAHAREEAALLRRLYPGARVLADAEAVSSRVRAALPGAPLVHFACHAVHSETEPSQGRLLLHDHDDSPFTVARISRLHLRRAELAVLSSCDTARIGARLRDEVIHLASSFLVAGFAQVVAVLWTVDDEVGHLFADDFHRRLAGRPLSCAAEQVHAAVLRARERTPNLPVHWAGHIHVGR
ncbi:hypothetical protein DN402_33250 [Streptomyces sp. SW4]|nr:hypothetical protein DN402_33250 [Streptomyces sp. SW4]